MTAPSDTAALIGSFFADAWIVEEQMRIQTKNVIGVAIPGNDEKKIEFKKELENGTRKNSD